MYETVLQFSMLNDLNLLSHITSSEIADRLVDEKYIESNNWMIRPLSIIGNGTGRRRSSSHNRPPPHFCMNGCRSVRLILWVRIAALQPRNGASLHDGYSHMESLVCVRGGGFVRLNKSSQTSWTCTEMTMSEKTEGDEHISCI